LIISRENENMPVESKIDKSRNLTTYTFAGEISSDDLVNTVKDFYEGEVTENLLIDFREARPDKNLLSHDLEGIARAAKQYWDLRESGKTAIVASTDIAFGLARMYEAFSKIADTIHSMRVFRSMDKAFEWLDSDSQ
jgi:hypothetical protein